MSESPDTQSGGLGRREVIAGGAAGLGALVLGTRAVAAARAAVPASARLSASCVLSPEMTEGPYWIDESLTRRDVTEDLHGMPLVLRLTVVRATSCRPIKGADVEIWHAAPDGEYSGFDGSSGTRYLRGHQRSDAAGRVRFDTLFPGWYRGRTPHIHLKVHVGGEEVHTGQLFMSEKVTRAVYRTRYYASRGQADTSHADDMIYGDGGARSTLRIRRRSGGRRGYVGRLELGVRT
jgi:protocatechuate 3,4-dioxygenase beta subunit